MRGDIKFTSETTEAMFALLRYLDYEYNFDKDRTQPETYKNKILDFKKYVSENKITSKVIARCHCKEGISNAEVIFNVCKYCDGVPSEDLLSHPAQNTNHITDRKA